MLAIQIKEFGPPEVLRPVNLPEPEPGPDEVLVEVEYSNITFVETQIRAGTPPHPSMLPELPAVIGNGVGGRVIRLGPGADPGLLGTLVVTSTGGSGGYAEMVAVPAAGLFNVPESLGLHDAVALLADGRTAMLLTGPAGIGPGDVVLIPAAAGGVGSMLVQVARNSGARVVAAARGPAKLDLAKQLGAEVTIDYSAPGWPEEVLEKAGRVDFAFDGVGGEIGRAAFQLVKPGGYFFAFGMASGEFAGITDEQALARDIEMPTGKPASPEELLKHTEAALAEAAGGKLEPVIGAVFPLEQAADAHAAIEAREVIGKTLLRVERPSGPPGSS